MAKKYDATSKVIFDRDPGGWVRLARIKAERVEIMDAELSTVAAAADKVVRVYGPVESLAQFEFQANYEALLPARSLKYSVLLSDKHGLPVHSIIVLMRPEADGPALSGTLKRHAGGRNYLEFRYTVIRLWELAPEKLLRDSVWMLPLVALTKLTRNKFRTIVQTMRKRIAEELAPAEKRTLFSAAYFLGGLRHSDEFLRKFMGGLGMLDEILEASKTYQATIKKGVDKGISIGEARVAKRILLRLGRKLGEPNERVLSAIERSSEEQVEKLIERVVKVHSWDELLHTSEINPLF